MEQNELLCEMKSKVEELEQEVKCKKVMNEAKSMNENKKAQDLKVLRLYGLTLPHNKVALAQHRRGTTQI